MPRRDPDKLARARELRANMSPPERALWALLRAHRLKGLKFSRQVACGPYFIDFAARMHRLAIELDGQTHAGQEAKDASRQAYIEQQGWRMIRFSNYEIGSNPDGVVAAIMEALGRSPDSPSPQPSPRGGEGAI